MSKFLQVPFVATPIGGLKDQGDNCTCYEDISEVMKDFDLTAEDVIRVIFHRIAVMCSDNGCRYVLSFGAYDHYQNYEEHATTTPINPFS